MKEKVLVTGGAGFIASHLVDKLVDLSYRVSIVDDLSVGKKENINPRAKFYCLDIGSKKLKEVFKKERPKYVFHFAAQKDLRKSVDDPVFDAQTNILGSLNLLQNCLNFKVKKFIFASTGGAIYGEADQVPTNENYWPAPLSPYGIAKFSLEHYLDYYGQVWHLPYIALRYSNIYGPRQDPKGEAGVVAIFVNKLLKKKQPLINGHGRQTRDYLYVSDAVRAAILVLKSKKCGCYNIGTAQETSVNQLFQKILKLGQFKAKEKHGSAKKGEQQRSCLSFKKAQKELKWSPKVKLDQGLKETIDWFRRDM